MGSGSCASVGSACCVFNTGDCVCSGCCVGCGCVCSGCNSSGSVDSGCGCSCVVDCCGVSVTLSSNEDSEETDGCTISTISAD